MKENRPNIILICTDQWRGDALGCAGHKTVDTPNLDRLALKGVRFTSAYTAVPSCIAARAALFTGLSQESHGRTGYRDNVPWDYETTLAGELTRGGYQTQAIGKMHVYPERSQTGFQNVILHDGFLHASRKAYPNRDAFDDYLPWLRKELGRDTDYFDHGIGCNSNVTRPWDKPEHTHPTAWAVTESINFLNRRDPGKPFFLYLSFHRPHPPYDPPAWALEQYLDEPECPAFEGNWNHYMDEFASPSDPDCLVGKVSPRRLKRARAGYFGSMTFIDQQINRLYEELESRRLRDNTWFCFVSDHGEMLGDHNMFRKATPYEGSASIPFILSGPEGCGLKADSTRDEPVELMDVMPTLLDCAGLPVPEGLDGKSVLPLCRGENPEWRSFVHGEHAILGQSLQFLTDGREKYIWWSGCGREQLFDLEKDPCESEDLVISVGQNERLEIWRSRMIGVLKNREEGYSDGTRLIPGRKPKDTLDFLTGN